MVKEYRIKVRYIGSYTQKFFGKSCEEINISSSKDATTRDLLKYLADKYRDRFPPRDPIAILLNGNTIDSTKLKAKLRPNSEVQLAFIPVTAGG